MEKLIPNEPTDSKYIYDFRDEEDFDEMLSLLPDKF